MILHLIQYQKYVSEYVYFDILISITYLYAVVFYGPLWCLLFDKHGPVVQQMRKALQLLQTSAPDKEFLADSTPAHLSMNTPSPPPLDDWRSSLAILTEETPVRQSRVTDYIALLRLHSTPHHQDEDEQMSSPSEDLPVPMDQDAQGNDPEYLPPPSSIIEELELEDAAEAAHFTTAQRITKRGTQVPSAAPAWF